MAEKIAHHLRDGMLGIFLAFVLGVTAINFGWNMTGQISAGLTALFGILGVVTIIRPESVWGQVLSLFLDGIQKFAQQNFSQNTQTPSNNKQTQKDTHGSGQAIADRGGQVNQTIIYQSSENKKKTVSEKESK